jgi:hypothetical protein
MQMKKPSWFALLPALIIVPVLATCQGQSVGAEAEASNLVQRFAQFDFDGYRLDSQGHQAIWSLTIDDGAPPESPVFVVRSYKAAGSQKAPDGSLRVSVDYNVIGLVGEGPKGLYFKPQTYLKRERFPVKCTHDGCRIDLDREVFHVSPHIGKEAALAWLKGIEGIRETEQEKQAAQSLYEQVKNAK